MDTPTDDPQEAPEEAWDEAERPKSAPNRVRPRKVVHTIASLRLDMAAAGEGKYYLLLPRDVRLSDGAESYPLPSDTGELAKVAELPLKQGAATNVGAKYIRRARRHMLERKKNLKLVEVEAVLDEAQGVAGSLNQTAKQAKDEIGRQIASVRQAAVETLTNLQDLNTEFKAGMMEIAKAFRSGKELHGQRVTVGAFVDAAGKVFTHTRGMAQGALDPGGKSEAESDLMAELAKSYLKQAAEGGTKH